MALSKFRANRVKSSYLPRDRNSPNRRDGFNHQPAGSVIEGAYFREGDRVVGPTASPPNNFLVA